MSSPKPPLGGNDDQLVITVLQTSSGGSERLRMRESTEVSPSLSSDDEGIEVEVERPQESLGQQLVDMIKSPTGIIMLTVLLLVIASWGVPWSQILFILVNWIQDIGTWGYIILVLSFVLISFPFTFGYTPLALAAGFLYGFYAGVVLTAIGSGVGALLAFIICRKFLQKDYIGHAFRKNKIGMVLFAMGESGWKGALLARMIPFPYGLANAILSMTSISFSRFMISTVVGLFPFQIMLVYFGTTIRSLADVVSGKSHFGIMQTFVLVLQALITVVSIFYFIYVARKYERASLEQLPNSLPEGPADADREQEVEVIPV